jgi:hypothetical protein
VSKLEAALVRARGLIADESKWEKGFYSTLKSGGFSYCAAGAALHSVRGMGGWPNSGTEMLEALGQALPAGWEDASIAEYNDFQGTTHSDILALFDRAIASCRG